MPRSRLIRSFKTQTPHRHSDTTPTLLGVALKMATQSSSFRLAAFHRGRPTYHPWAGAARLYLLSPSMQGRANNQPRVTPPTVLQRFTGPPLVTAGICASTRESLQEYPIPVLTASELTGLNSCKRSRYLAVLVFGVEFVASPKEAEKVGDIVCPRCCWWCEIGMPARNDQGKLGGGSGIGTIIAHHLSKH